MSDAFASEKLKEMGKKLDAIQPAYLRHIEQERSQAQKYSQRAYYFEGLGMMELAERFRKVVYLCDEKIAAMRECVEIANDLLSMSKLSRTLH